MARHDQRRELGPDGECDVCSQTHTPARGTRPCSGHVPVKDENGRIIRPDGSKVLRPCKASPMRGQDVCRRCGGASPQAKAAAAQRETEAKVTTEIIRRLGDAGETVTDPIAKLCGIAGRAVAFMEALADKTSELDVTDDNDRATIALYGRSIKDAAAVVESIIRMGIAERLAKADAERTAAIVAFIDGVLSDLGHNPRDPEVAGAVARRLELVS